ncbi:thiol reductant ABC exporter subunit CydD [Pseudonocardia sp. WMMC193]|uniref:thiol reductant ABC exporter subunit CydD n=1 Tax=Pseudonocardia sp. WMMC193 TaxID=2911965 RepID=UPI001F00D73E|nr:thiol reductant ABC exporter subunit CydD [Pseudonocardia sp. WMMC193]MCF7550649.1 thiol reductant ABC exporter subunit CydD [Pseudonocardia sp. WMMC193]
MRPLDPRLLRQASAARRFVLLGLGVAVATAALVMVQADLLSRVIADGFLGGVGLDLLAPLLGLLLAAVAGRAGLAWIAEVAAHRASADVVRELRGRIVGHVLRLGPRRADLPPRGELATLTARGLDDLEGYFGRYLPALLVAAVVPAMLGVRILTADWVSAVIVGLTVPLVPVFAVLVGLHTERATARQWRALAVLGHHFLDLVSGLDVLVAFGRDRHQTSGLRTLAEAYRRATLRTLRVAFLSSLVLELVATLSVALVAVSIGLRLVDGSLDLGTGLLVLLLAPEVYLPLRAVGARFHDAAAGTAAAGAALDLLDTAAPESGRAGAPDPALVGLRLRGVRVDGRLAALDLDLPPRAVVGITGPSGSGKSTLLDVLAGLRAPDGGTALAGDTDLAGVEPTWWRRRVAWVPQRPVLTGDTVREAITLAVPDAGPASVARAARLACLDVPLDTPLGEDGGGLSTGQRRRVALARAILADRPLLLLDEPTEGVDADTETRIGESLDEIAAGRTVVVVSHRADVLGRCHRVVSLAPPTDQPGAGGETPLPARPTPAGSADDAATPRPPAATRPTPRPSRPGPPGLPAWVRQAAREQRARLVLAVLLAASAWGSGVALTATSAWLISTAALQPPVLTLMVAIVAVRAFGLGKGVFRYAERLVSHDAALRVGSALRVRLWGDLVRLGPAATARHRRGDLLVRLIADTEAPQDLLVRVLLPGCAALLVGGAAVAGFLLLLPAAGLALAVGLLVAGVGAPAVAAWAAHRSEHRTAALRSEVASRTVELLDAAADLLVFGAADRHRHALAHVDDQLATARRRAARATGAGTALAVLAIGTTAVVCAALGLTAYADGRIAGPVIAVLALTPLALAEIVAGLPEAAVRLLSIVPAAERLQSLESLEPAVVDPEHAPDAASPTTLDAEDLAVRWPGSDRDAVAGLDLDLAVGHRIALVGPSGSGKSTAVAALLRTLAPRAGTLRADGTDVRMLRGEQVRHGIAWCGSWTHLFDGSLRANLTLAAPDATDAELVAVLRRARLGGWFARLPAGLDTPVGAHGGTVSGGERQRLGIARALLADRPILVLDEPTAHLDEATAADLSAEILAATADRTALVVTHRPDHTPGLTRVEVGREPVRSGR